MKLLHFIYDHPGNPWVGGGGAHRVAILNGLLEKRGHRVDVFSGQYPGCTDYQSGNLAYYFLGNSRNYMLSTFSYAISAQKLARRIYRDFDLIIEDFAPWNPVFTYRLKGRPSIIQIQNYFGAQILRKYALFGLPFYFGEALYPRRFSNAIVINEALNRRLRIHGRVISMGIDESLLKMDAAEGGYIAFLGRLDIHQKGVDILLGAAKGLAIPVKVAGDGPGRKRLMREIAKVPNIEWVGWLKGKSKTDFLRKAKFLVVPSRFEGQNMAVLEAAALGKAVLVSNIDELSYAVRHGFGVAFRSGSSRELRAGMIQLWQDELLRGRLEGVARGYVKDLTWPKLADSYEAFCQEAILACR